MKNEGIYIVNPNGEQTFLSPPSSGYGEIQILYCNSIPVSTKEIRTMRLTETKKSKVTN
ncbi:MULTISPECIES: hypothetical protein [Bacillus]|uniref:hypothetical protein n=1 Tax=Bacillus TaxID=1386 RepID=UPI0002797EC0|nr:MULTISPECIES: hypothetical protein [Bacillus]EJP82716.1 hypothetical protein IAU_05709 [Bacillus cereus IS075]EOO82281.1 hypothetical protein IGS_05862 [Bacillus cereus IS845/00]EOO91856.1 hypothetical protein IGQ_05967 [Bacillus cereus IS195]KLA08210.1 hypothetical protein B4153_5739 [Bacillus cereus]MCC2436164.1 hypothetical protein [Bacillus paranthracis]